jgi:hypothetical protein
VTPCRNLSRHDPANGTFGDCQRACVAAILDLAPEEVPHFAQIEHDGGPPWLESLRAWLADYGFGYFQFAYAGDETLERILEITAQNCPGLPLILGGAAAVSPDVGHSVVIMDGKIVMDPSSSGVCGPIPDVNVWAVEAICIGPAWGGRLFKPTELAA